MRNIWYENPEILYNIITICKEREIVFLAKTKKEEKDIHYTVRNIFAHYINFLKSNFDAFHFYERPYNVYYSLATFKKINRFSFEPNMRKIQRTEFNLNAINNMSSFDFGLDFDAKDLEHWHDAWLDAKKIKDDLDFFGVAYSIKFSGGKGFHIRIPYSSLPNHLKITSDINDVDNIFIFLKTIAELMSVHYDLKTLDLGVFDPRRIWKCDYSITCDTGLVVFPLSDFQFENFNLNIVSPITVLKGGIRNRGILIRNNTTNNNIICFKKYCSEVLAVDI